MAQQGHSKVIYRVQIVSVFFSVHILQVHRAGVEVFADGVDEARVGHLGSLALLLLLLLGGVPLQLLGLDLKRSSCSDLCSRIHTNAANRLIGEVVQSRRRPLLGPSPG